MPFWHLLPPRFQQTYQTQLLHKRVIDPELSAPIYKYYAKRVSDLVSDNCGLLYLIAEISNFFIMLNKILLLIRRILDILFIFEFILQYLICLESKLISFSNNKTVY
jgi:hypothetical protein